MTDPAWEVVVEKHQVSLRRGTWVVWYISRMAAKDPSYWVSSSPMQIPRHVLARFLDAAQRLVGLPLHEPALDRVVWDRFQAQCASLADRDHVTANQTIEICDSCYYDKHRCPGCAQPRLHAEPQVCTECASL